MSSKLKKLKDLERILTVTIPLEDYKDKFQSKINNIKGQAKLDGFRKGKVPNDVLEQKYGASIHADVVNDLIQASYPEALKENNLRPASSPTVKLESEDPSKPLVYSATFEIFPDIKPKVSSWTKYETFSINISDEDVNLAIEDICKRYGEWNDVDRESAKEDQVIIDFKGLINGEEFEGNSAADFKLVLGSNSMIPGFEDELIGKSKSEFKINAKFPDDYFKKDLAGSDATFEINLKTVQELTPAKIDKELFTKLEMDIEDETKFKAEILSRMEKEVKTQEKDLTKESIYETLLKINSFSAPKVTIKEQAEMMRKDSLMRIGQQENDATDDLFPLDTFMENAEKRVKLDLLFAELIKHYALAVTQEDLDNFIEAESKKYKDASQFKQWIENQPQQIEQFRMIVLEQKLVDNLKNDLKSKDKVIEFSELANK